MLILGEKEATSGNVTTRNRKDEAETLTVDEFIAKAVKEVEDKVR